MGLFTLEKNSAKDKAFNCNDLSYIRISLIHKLVIIKFLQRIISYNLAEFSVPEYMRKIRSSKNKCKKTFFPNTKYIPDKLTILVSHFSQIIEVIFKIYQDSEYRINPDPNNTASLQTLTNSLIYEF